MNIAINLNAIRELQWIWDNPQWLKQWMDILYEASQPEQLVGVRDDVIERKVGQCVKSFGEWSEQWKITKDAARYFIELLEKKEFIITESLLFSTRLTINNFSTFATITHDKQRSGSLTKVKQESKTKTLHTQIKDIFLVFYKEAVQGEDYYWTRIDGAKVSPLVDKILFKIKKKHESKNIPPKANYDSEIIEGFLFLLNSIQDEWLLKNLSMAIIDSKFNNIYSNLKANATKLSATANRKPSKFDGYEDAYKLVMESRGLISAKND
jgi:hypothetical protein